MWGSHCVYILFCAIKLCASPIPVGTRNTHTYSMSKICITCSMNVCTLRVCTCVGTDQVNREKTRCQLQKWSCPVGEGEPGSLPARAASRQCAFLKTLGRAGLGEWLFKTLGSFYFTTMEVNSVLKCQSKWSHLASAGSLRFGSGSQTGWKSEGPSKLFFLTIKIDSHRIWHLGFTNFFLWKEVKIIEKVKDHLALEGMLSKTTPLMKFHRVTA